MMMKRLTWVLAIVVGSSLGQVAQAKSPEGSGGDAGRYIVVLEQPSLAEWFASGGAAAGQGLTSAGSAKAAAVPPAGRLNANSPESREYLSRLDREFEAVGGAFRAALGRELSPVHRYRTALNGFSVQLAAGEAGRVAKLPGVRLVEKDAVQKIHTDAGPAWIGADDVWAGAGGLPPAKGEGVIVGVLDTGVNWGHKSFLDPGEGTGNTGVPYDHNNPLGQQLGLCAQPEVPCNDKLIGVYDFVTDDPTTEDVVEENNNGEDNDGHGSHTASTAAGNPVSYLTSSGTVLTSGVAPNANLVTYRVCYVGDPDDPDDDGCQNSAIMAAIDQAVTDGVDSINYSLGGSVTSPWTPTSTQMALLNAVGAGIFVATSAGNSGPGASTIGSPANAPWIMAVGNGTHDRVLGVRLQGLAGGAAAPPPDLVGASRTGNLGSRKIVYAGDYGNALCGEGAPELGASCNDNTGASNPFAPGTFNGEIVVCDRGTYGRVEKGKNVLQAGAGGYVLANSAAEGKSIVADTHCLPATHLTYEDGSLLRQWLASGSNHTGSLSAVSSLRSDSVADVVTSSSSRGPNEPPVEDILKPDLLAPGTSIIAAYSRNDSDYAYLTGTSMASPHVAGAAALLLSVHPDWSPSQLASVLLSTAEPALATDSDGAAATPFERGAGRPVLGDAANAGLFLGESRADFEAANPVKGGQPKNLNLATLSDSNCKDSCSFTRTVTSMTSTKTWSLAPAGFPDGVTVTITPNTFSLANGASRTVTIDVDHGGAGLVGQWIYGTVSMTASGAPRQDLTVAVYASGGDLATGWEISDNGDSGSVFVYPAGPGGLTALPDATFTSAGPVRPQSDTRQLPEDPTHDDPYDGPTGTFTVWHEVPEGTLWLYSETLASTANDLDLFVGLDRDGDGVADEDEELCSSTSPDELEWCDIFTPEAGRYWILVQNWDAGATPPDEATLLSAVVGPSGALGLTATGPGVVAKNETFPLRLGWSNLDAVTDEQFLGAVGVGTDRDHPNNVGVVPIYFKRVGVRSPSSLPLMDGVETKFALQAGAVHDRLFIDVPPGATGLTVTAGGLTGDQSNALKLELKRMDFSGAFGNAPLASPAPGTAPVASATGSGGVGPSLNVSGGSLQSGRWYAVLTNTGGAAVAVNIKAQVAFNSQTVPMHGGLWYPLTRPDINQGYEFSAGGDTWAVIWYTYDEAHGPTWYLAAEPKANGNIFTADLLRYTNDGAEQQSAPVGKLSITMLAEKDQIFSFNLFGSSGSDRMQILSQNTCPQIQGLVQSVTGLWFRGQDGLGGASVLYDDSAHYQIHYIYDQVGYPRWLGAGSPSANTLEMQQFTGDCPGCPDNTASNFQVVGTLTHQFLSATTGNWALNYVLQSPLAGSVNRSENIYKLTNTLQCQ